MVASRCLHEPPDEEVALWHRLTRKLSLPSAVSSFTHSDHILIVSDFTVAVNQAGKAGLSDSPIRYCTPLIRLSQSLTSISEAFDEEDAAPICMTLTASMLLFSTLLLVHMVGINPWDMPYGPRCLFAPRITASYALMNYGIRHRYANLGISLVMPLYSKLQWLIYHVWTEVWREEVLAAMALTHLFSFTSWKDEKNKTLAFSCSISPSFGELQPASTANCQAT